MSCARSAKSAPEFTSITKNFGADPGMTSNPTFAGCAGNATTQRMASARFGNGIDMDKTVYDRRSWRNLPRDYCIVEHLLGAAAGPCSGLIHHHHVDPTDEGSRTVQVCAGHHSRVHAALRGLSAPERRRRCPHHHRTREGREACERRLQRAA